jgi:pyridoxal/pyridoxine/pyridoxamine kinase
VQLHVARLLRSARESIHLTAESLDQPLRLQLFNGSGDSLSAVLAARAAKLHSRRPRVAQLIE